MTTYKSVDLKAKDIDEQKRKVLIYVSEFGSKDSDNDVITKGAYTKTIKENGPGASKPRIKHFLQHYDLIGRPLEMTEDEKGLLVLSQISGSTLGRDVIENYKDDLYEHSVGFEIEKAYKDEGANIQYIQEIKLWEYSSVTWGANPNTPLVAMKGHSTEDVLKRLNSKMNKIINALRKGNYTDEGFEALEIQLKFINDQYNEIINSLKPSHDTLKPDYKALGELFDNIKIKV